MLKRWCTNSFFKRAKNNGDPKTPAKPQVLLKSPPETSGAFKIFSTLDHAKRSVSCRQTKSFLPKNRRRQMVNFYAFRA